MKALFKPVSAALLASFLAACSLIPPAQQSSQRQIQARQNLVQTAADTGQKPPEKVTFPSMVKTTPLDTNLPADKNDQLNAALEQALAEKPAEEGFHVQNQNLPQVFILRFMAETKNLKQQVKIPENGAFQLVLEAGTGKKLEILDGDGSDGQATIRLPQHTYEALLHLQGPWQPNSSLEVNDELYYVQDTLTSKQGKPIDLNRWFLLGVRPLPVPSDWYNPDGQKLVLKFKTDTVKEFQMAWWTTNQQAAYPPGIKQIGPAGGTVELPGVAKLDLPAGALSAPTVVVMRQQKEVASRKDYCPYEDDPNKCYLGWVFAAPIVKIEPLGLKLNKPAPLDLPIYKFFERYSPRSIGSVGSLDINNTFSWQYFPYLAKRPNIRKLSDITHHNIIMSLQQFAYISRQTHYLPSVEEFYQSEGFKIQNAEETAPCNIAGSQQDDSSEHFYINDNEGKVCPEALEKAKKYLESGYSSLTGRGWEMTPPRGAYNPEGLEEHFIEVQFIFQSGGDHSAQEVPVYGPQGQYLGALIKIFVDKEVALNSPLDSEVVLHELFHAFQDAHMKNRLEQLKKEERAMIEGTATFVGFFLTQELKNGFGFIETIPTKSFYANRVKHLETLDTSLFLRLDEYNAPVGRDAYDTVAFWTHLFHSYGTQGIAELIHLYGSKHRVQGILTRSIASLSDLLKQKSGSPTIDDYYLNFVKDAIIQKNVSLFTEIELNHIAYKKKHIISNTHTVQNPLLVSSEGTEPLSVVNLLLQADQKIRQPRNLYIRSISPTPETTFLVNNQEGYGKIRDFLYPGLVGVNNTEGIAFKTEIDSSGRPRRKPHISSDFSISKQGYLMISSFGHEQPVKSAILSIYNTLWKVSFWNDSRKNAFTMNLEVFLGPKLLSAEWPKEKDGQDITTDKAAPQLDLTGTGFDPSKTEIIFQPRSEVGKEIKQKPVFLEPKIDSDGVEIQNMFVNIPNQALKGGWIEARSANIPSNRIEQTTYACNMLPTNASFSTAVQKPCPQ